MWLKLEVLQALYDIERKLRVSKADHQCQRELTPISQVRVKRGAETLLERCQSAFARWRDSLSQLFV